MPIHLPQNPYRGVNAHLNSILQSRPGGWEGFHLMHIGHLVEAVRSILPAGYVVEPEMSFQIRAFHPDSGEEIRLVKSSGGKIAKPDLAIYTSAPSPSASGPLVQETAPALILEPSETFDDPRNYLGAVAVKVVNDNQIGQVVTWIELLSPTNKPLASGYDQYNEKRLGALSNDIVMVEIDYLHESPPIISSLPRYPGEGYPYSILVTDPRPKNRGYFYGFFVDQPMPVVRIPLLGSDAISLDFGAVYNRTFELFSHRVDYEQEPPHMDTYSADDQQRIRAKMAAVLQMRREQAT